MIRYAPCLSAQAQDGSFRALQHMNSTRVDLNYCYASAAGVE
jgi:hypothetical protein